MSHSVLAAMTEQPADGGAVCRVMYHPGRLRGSGEGLRHPLQQGGSAGGVCRPVRHDGLSPVLSGVGFGMTAATILTVQQLSETDRYRRQFELLRKLGMDGTEMGRALRRQFALYYAMPVLPAGIIGVAFVRNLGGAVEPGTLTGLYSPGMITAAALGLFFLLYGIYILMAYTSLKRTVLPEP